MTAKIIRLHGERPAPAFVCDREISGYPPCISPCGGCEASQAGQPIVGALVALAIEAAIAAVALGLAWLFGWWPFA